MNLESRFNLPFTSATLSHQGRSVELYPILVDTGSASTVVSADAVEAIGISPRPDDILEIGGMDYGFEIQGIIGMDFLRRTGAILNLGEMTMEFDKR